MRYWTFEEFRQVYNQIDNIKSKTALNLLYFTGMRKGELDALTWEKIDFKIKLY
ncbi:MAG: tyrosine-type recombinase/integrase [Anaerococcus obesiensis]